MSPIEDAFGALGEEMEEATPGVPVEDLVCLHIRKRVTLTNDHEILKGAPFNVAPNTNALC